MLDINEILDFLACPYCQAKLSYQTGFLFCNSCNQTYEFKESGQIDLRLRKAKLVDHSIMINKPQTIQEYEFSVLTHSPNSHIDHQVIEIPKHLSTELVSYFPNPNGGKVRVLDLGCGNSAHRDLLESIGYEWIGLDYYHDNAPILGDGQALPFQDNSFDFVLAVSMLHEIPYPFIATQEVNRALKPGGTFVGTAPFLEPYYHTTTNHFSHAGIFYLLDMCGFELDVISPSSTWSVLDSLPEMVLFPRLPNFISKAIVLPLKISHQMWWKLAHALTRKESANALSRIMATSGSTDFVVKKPAI